jgi:hypothetical protein
LSDRPSVATATANSAKRTSLPLSSTYSTVSVGGRVLARSGTGEVGESRRFFREARCLSGEDVVVVPAAVFSLLLRLRLLFVPLFPLLVLLLLLHP